MKLSYYFTIGLATMFLIARKAALFSKGSLFNKVTVPKCDTVSSRFVTFKANSVFYWVFIGTIHKIIKI